MANYDGSLVFDTKIDTSGLQNDLGKLGNVARSGAQVTTAAIASIGAAIASVAAASFKVGSEFESAFAGVQKTVNATEEEFAALRQGILDLARDMPLAATEIAGIAEAAGQLGIQTQNIMSFTKTMADLGVATNMSSEEAATALARLANITQMPQENFDRLGATIVDLGNNLATTEREIVDMSLRLAGAGNQVGLTEDQILSFSGALSSVGIAAEAGGTAFSKLMSDMQLAVKTGSESLQDFADVAGMSAQEFQRAFEEDAASAIISFIDGLANAQDSVVSRQKEENARLLEQIITDGVKEEWMVCENPATAAATISYAMEGLKVAAGTTGISEKAADDTINYIMGTLGLEVE